MFQQEWQADEAQNVPTQFFLVKSSKSKNFTFQQTLNVWNW